MMPHGGLCCLRLGVLLACSLIICACDKSKDSASASEQRTVVNKPVSRVTPQRSKVRTPKPPSHATARSVSPATTPASTPEPSPTPAVEPVVVRATDMHYQNGVTTDTEGGLFFYGQAMAQVDHFKLPFPATDVVLEMKGQPAGNIWPEVECKLYSWDKQKWYTPWERDYVTTSTYQEYHKPQQPPLPAGDYIVRLRYYNDLPVPEGEDRNVWLRKITFLP